MKESEAVTNAGQAENQTEDQDREEPIPGGPNYPSIPKGIVEMTLGDLQLAPKIAKERGTS